MYNKTLRVLPYIFTRHSALCFSCTGLLLRRADRGRCESLMSRPYKEPPVPMSVLIVFRCTENMKKSIDDAAAAANITTGDVIRRRLKGLRIPDCEHLRLIDEIGSLRQQISKQGGLLKHLASENHESRNEFNAALKAQAELFQKCTAVLDATAALYGSNDNRSAE